MFDLVTTSATRTVLALATATTVGMTGLAGAAQAGYNEYDDEKKVKKVHVTICKEVKKHKDDDDDDYFKKPRDDDDKKFLITAASRIDSKPYRVADGDCKTKRLFFKNRKLTVTEHEKGYEVRYRPDYGVEKTGYNTFRIYKKHVQVTVINKKKKHDDDDDDY